MLRIEFDRKLVSGLNNIKNVEQIFSVHVQEYFQSHANRKIAKFQTRTLLTILRFQSQQLVTSFCSIKFNSLSKFNSSKAHI